MANSLPAGAAAFRNSQEYLQRQAPLLAKQRRRLGLEGLVGDLAGVIINVEPELQSQAVEEFQHYTGMSLGGAFRGPDYLTAVLRLEGRSGQARPADVLIRSRNNPAANPFGRLNDRPKSRHLPNTRLETFFFECSDLERYVAIQQGQGVRFVTDQIVRTDTYWFIQTQPSQAIGASYGFIQWLGSRRDYSFSGAQPVDWRLPSPAAPYRGNIGRLDHLATRLPARSRDEAILESVRLTNHSYQFSIYVESLNSITNVSRRSADDVGLVFTSGIAPFADEASAGPTEMFVHNYGPRTHHLAFATEDIENTFAALKADGMTFMIELVGGPSEGLHQTFTNPSGNTLLVTEYIHRYGGFTGYFTLSNVTALTLATGKQ
jgi:hypothetical protein